MSAPQFSFLASDSDQSGVGVATWKYIGLHGVVQSVELRAKYPDAHRIAALIATAHKTGQREGAALAKRAIDTALREILE